MLDWNRYIYYQCEWNVAINGLILLHIDIDERGVNFEQGGGDYCLNCGEIIL